MDNERAGEVDVFLDCIKGSLEVSSQELNMKPIRLNVCSSWGHIQGWNRERVEFSRLWSCHKQQKDKCAIKMTTELEQSKKTEGFKQQISIPID